MHDIQSDNTIRQIDNTIAKINLGMDAVFACPPVQRSNAFSGVYRAIGLWLMTLDGGTDPSQIDFVRRARIYMRALKTYPASSEEWLEVFRAFRQMHDHWTQTAPSHRELTATRAAGETERLRQNPHIVFKQEDR